MTCVVATVFMGASHSFPLVTCILCGNLKVAIDDFWRFEHMCNTVQEAIGYQASPFQFIYFILT